MLIDIHCHLDHQKFKGNLDQVIERARKAGMSHIITSGVNKSSNRKVLEISKKYDIVFPSLGLYPIDALNKEIEAEGLPRDVIPFDADEEIEFIKKKRGEILGIGEAGLDFALSTMKEEQKVIFQKVIELAEKIKKPLIVHSRKAEREVLDMLESSKLKKVVLHCFSANMKLVKCAEEMNYSFSIPPVIVRLQHFQTLVEKVSLKNLLTETDAPYLSPVFGERNEPKNVVESIKMISKIKKIDYEEAKKIIFMNFQNIFLK